MRSLMWFLLFSPAVSAGSLPTILDYYPSCFAEPAQSLIFNGKMVTKGLVADISSAPAFSD